MSAPVSPPPAAGTLGVASDHLEWALSWPWELQLAVGVLASVVLVLSWLNLRQLASGRRRAALFGLRLLVVASLVAVLFQPTWVSRAERPAGRRVAVLVDRSQSMAQGPAGRRRWDTALEAVETLAGGPGRTWLPFAADLEPARSRAALGKLQPTGARTDVLAALTALADRQRVTGLAGVVVVSDGLDNGPLRARNPAPEAALDSESAELVERLRVPVHAVFVDDVEPLRDLAVTALRGSSFGFTRTWMPLAVDLEVAGYAGRQGSLSLVLSDNGKPVVTRHLPLDGPTRRTVELEYQPLHVGSHVLEAAVVPLPDEATDTNNRAFAGLRVVRDRTRVLHLAGHPSWDTRFLRTHLRGDPAVDLVSFYVMVGQGSGAFVAAEDTTLIPFPTREIFEDSLTSFDLVIFQDFPFGPFQVEQYLPQLRAYVTGGGAFLVLGGKQALSAGGYYGTALADWLPVRLLPPAGDDVGYVEGPVQPALTPVGRTHPVSLLADDAESNAAVWARHSLLGRNTGLQAAEAGHVLVTSPGGHPLLAVGEAGEGRSAVVATDSLWTWAFPPQAAEGHRDRSRAEYHRLLDQLTAWLLRDPDLDSLRVEPPAEPVPAGQPARLRVTARGGDGRPLAGLALRYAVTPLVQMPAELPGTTAWPRPTDDQGDATLQLTLQPGAWLLTVEADLDGRPQRATAPIMVAASAGDLAQLQPDDRLLQALATASGGKVWRSRPPADVPMARGEADQLAEKVHTDLWSRPEVLVWLVGLLGLEWVLRRRWGLA